jgi:hypothetical protein
VTTGVVPGCGVALGATDGRGVGDGATGVETCAVARAGALVGAGVTVAWGRFGVAVGAETGADEAAGAVPTGVGVGNAPATTSGSFVGAGEGPCATCGGGVCVGRGVLDGTGAFGVACGAPGAGCSIAGAG